ncbi:hypothetical protein V6N13_061300 [Hibiscus sabdariffa]|uniref:Uncharacterized protein n=1 Tax=Hibiscus sabdariffa TaxID=183260 RepID=A0ABR2EFR5_9ROSI
MENNEVGDSFGLENNEVGVGILRARQGLMVDWLTERRGGKSERERPSSFFLVVKILMKMTARFFRG